MTGEPLLVRVAGLPVSALEPFGQGPCREALRTCERSAEDLRAARADLADRLHGFVPGSPAPLRRFLLSARRDCFNGRRLAGRRAEPEWSTLSGLAGELAERVLQFEESLEEAQAGLAAAYEHQAEREHRHLRDVLGDRAFLRGVAMASPVSVENAHRLRETPGRDRKETRLEATLLRYVSRAAFKLSPFSTFTRLALGSLREDVRGPSACRLDIGWQERSLLRLKRYVLDQCWELLRSHPPVRESLAVTLNNTLEEVAPGRYRFLRPGYWALSPEQQAFRFFLPAVVKADLGGPAAAWLLRELPGWQPAYRELLDALEAAGVTASGQARDTLDRFLRVGLLTALPPWPAHEAYLEERMARFLQDLGAPGTEEISAVLERIVALEKGFDETDRPECTVTEIERLAGDLWAAAAPLSGLPPGLEHGKLRTGNFYEDVFLQPEPRVREGIVSVSRPATQRVLRDLQPLARGLALFSHRHEFLLTLNAFLARRWDGQREVGLLDLFGALQPIWQEYVKFIYAARLTPPATLVFNPLELKEIEDLHRLRQAVLRDLTGLLEPAAEGNRIDSARLAALAAGLPACYAPLTGPCVFLQPADAAGDLWVVNRLFEGTGRYSSRFTAVMDESARRSFTDHLSARSMGDGNVENAEFLDLMCAQGDTLNVHAVQTRYVLEMPGETLDLPADRRVHLRDLRVRRGEVSGRPWVVDTSGRRFLPVHLGGAGFDFLPTPLKILSLLGPGEMSLLELPRSYRQENDVKVRERLTLGNTVLLRKRWFIAPNSLPSEVEGLSGAEAFAAVNRWRLERGIPDRVFFIERIHHERGDKRFKPQYLDFTSPSFVRMFQSSLRLNAKDLTFEEMLPVPEAVARDGEGRGWALELMLDTLALHPPRPDRADVALDESAPAALLAAGEQTRLHETGVAFSGGPGL